MNPNYPYTATNTNLHTNVPTTATHMPYGAIGTNPNTNLNPISGPSTVLRYLAYTTTTTTHGTYTTHPAGYTQGQMYKWNNPYGLSIPVIAFDPNCKKCHGSGTAKSRFSGTPLPCPRCYTRQGYCKKCYGTGTNYRKNKPCTKCQAGKRMNNKSSSSSDSN
jgi:hypothetical protein